MKDIVLVNSTPLFARVVDRSERVEVTQSPPLGILYLAAVLEREGYAVAVEDMIISRHCAESLAQAIEGVSLVGIGTTTPAFHTALEIARAVKARSPETIVVMGGPHVTFMAEETVRNSNVDIVVRGEGEETIAELAAYILMGKGRLKDIKGLTYGKNNTIRSSPDRLVFDKLDTLPFPARHLLDMSVYRLRGSLISGRGCPYKCQFCAAGPLSGYRYRVRSPENVVEEMEYCHREFGFEEFIFADDSFTAFPERTVRICELIKELEFSPTWTCESRVNTVTPSLLKVMADSGCQRIQYGVEAGNNHVLKSINKLITVEMIEHVVDQTLDAGMKVVCNFILGHPEDTRETVRQTIGFAKNLREKGNVETIFAIATPYPGTELWNRAEDLGIEIITKNWDQYEAGNAVISTKHLSASDLRSLMIEAIFGDITGGGADE
jgi:anaerobic magnesium-protoporphyrin IX monomethyl ester cyclase